MPIYEYRCQECRNTFEEERSMNEVNEASSPACAECKSTNVNRIWNAHIRSGAKSSTAARAANTQPAKPSGGCCMGSSHSCGS